MFKNFPKIKLILLLALLCGSVFFAGGETLAYSNSAKTELENDFTIGSLEFSLDSEGDFASRVTPEDDSTRTISVIKEGSLGFKYTLEAKSTEGDLCEYLDLKVERNGTEVYEGDLEGFSYDAGSFSDDEWDFVLSLKEDVVDYEEKSCDFDFYFYAWQEELDKEDDGFTHGEQVSNRINPESSDSLEFSLYSEGDFSPSEIVFGEESMRSVTVSNVGSLDFEYALGVENLEGDLCEYLDLKVERNGTEVYEGDLEDFSYDAGSFSDDEWDFVLSINNETLDPQEKGCEFNIVFDAWEEGFDKDDDVMKHREVLSSSITSGDWNYEPDPDILPVVEVIYPSGGEAWFLTWKYTIEWSATSEDYNDEDLDIEIFMCKGDVGEDADFSEYMREEGIGDYECTHVITDHTTNTVKNGTSYEDVTGTYRWQVPNDPYFQSNELRVMVVATDSYGRTGVGVSPEDFCPTLPPGEQEEEFSGGGGGGSSTTEEESDEPVETTEEESTEDDSDNSEDTDSTEEDVEEENTEEESDEPVESTDEESTEDDSDNSEDTDSTEEDVEETSKEEDNTSSQGDSVEDSNSDESSIGLENSESSSDDSDSEKRESTSTSDSLTEDEGSNSDLNQSNNVESTESPTSDKEENPSSTNDSDEGQSSTDE